MERRMRGTGSVFQRASDGMWVAQLSVGPRHARRRITKTIGPREPGERQKKAALAELREKVAGPRVRGETTGAYLVRWVSEVRNIRPSTRYGYRMAIVTHVVPAIGSIPLADLAPRDVERMLARFDSALSPKTARNAHGVLRRALGQAVRQGIITSNPAGREFVDAPRVSVADPAAFTDDELALLTAKAKDDRIGPLIVVAAETGLRQGELLGLAWENVGAGTVTVEFELSYRRENGYERTEPKTPRSRRTVPLSETARQAFEDQRARLKADGFVPIATGPVFTNHRGKALSGSWVTHRLYHLEAAAGVRRLAFKNLRSTFASRLNERGVDQATIASLLGHAPGSRVTGRHYIASSETMARSAVARLNQPPNQPRVRGEAG